MNPIQRRKFLSSQKIKLAKKLFDAYKARVLSNSGITESDICNIDKLDNLDAINLLQSATFVLAPSGYKSGVAYSQVPSNGNGDLTWTRASNANRTNSSGIIEIVASGVPRLSYMYGSCPSALLEPQRTNSIRNSTMVGAVVGSPGTLPTNYSISPFNVSGLSRSVVGIGSENGLQYVDIRFNGTATGTVFSIAVDANISESPLQIFANSMYLRYVSSPSLPNSSNLVTNFFNNTTFINSQITNISITTTLTRFVGIHTASSSALNVATSMLSFILTNGQSYDFTIRVAQPQIELGSFATTPIFTTGTSATRIADTFARNNIYTNGLIGASGFTWLFEIKNNISIKGDQTDNTKFYGMFIGNSSTSPTSAICIYNDNTTALLKIGTISGTVTTPRYTTAAASIKVAITYDGTTLNAWVNGTKQISSLSFSATLSAFEHLAAINTDVPKYIAQMALWNTILPDSQCASLTS